MFVNFSGLTSGLAGGDNLVKRHGKHLLCMLIQVLHYKNIKIKFLQPFKFCDNLLQFFTFQKSIQINDNLYCSMDKQKNKI